jgi:hypothetical protein
MLNIERERGNRMRALVKPEVFCCNFLLGFPDFRIYNIPVLNMLPVLITKRPATSTMSRRVVVGSATYPYLGIYAHLLERTN